MLAKSVASSSIKGTCAVPRAKSESTKPIQAREASAGSLSGRHKQGCCPVSCRAAQSETFSSPKTGLVGEERFKETAVSGTYWGPPVEQGAEVSVQLDVGGDVVVVSAHEGENLLRVGERSGAFVPTSDFCFEGTCNRCEVEVEGGAQEIGYRAEPSSQTVVRSCICPVPQGRRLLAVKVLSKEDVWSSGIL